MSCAWCECAVEEAWPRGTAVLRCGFRGLAEEMRGKITLEEARAPETQAGRVVLVYPMGRRGCFEEAAPPVWCPKKSRPDGRDSRINILDSDLG